MAGRLRKTERKPRQVIVRVDLWDGIKAAAKVQGLTFVRALEEAMENWLRASSSSGRSPDAGQ